MLRRSFLLSSYSCGFFSMSTPKSAADWIKVVVGNGPGSTFDMFSIPSAMLTPGMLSLALTLKKRKIFFALSTIGDEQEMQQALEAMRMQGVVFNCALFAKENNHERFESLIQIVKEYEKTSRAQLLPRQAVVFGDTPSDIEAVQKANEALGEKVYLSIGVYGTSQLLNIHSHQEYQNMAEEEFHQRCERVKQILKESEADFLIQDLTHFPQLLEQLNRQPELAEKEKFIPRPHRL